MAEAKKKNKWMKNLLMGTVGMAPLMGVVVYDKTRSLIGKYKKFKKQRSEDWDKAHKQYSEKIGTTKFSSAPEHWESINWLRKQIKKDRKTEEKKSIQ